jgi:hypothetical protein
MSPLFTIKSRLDFIRYLNSQGLTDVGIEIGVLFGEYSEFILSNWPGVLHMVDPWLNQAPAAYLDGCNAVDMEAAYGATIKSTEKFGSRARIYRAFSNDAVNIVQRSDLDFVFLDGNHKQSAVNQDIQLWWPHIKSGGVLAGHDFYERHDAYQDCGVKTAVQNFARENKLQVVLTEDTSWFIQKP